MTYEIINNAAKTIIVVYLQLHHYIPIFSSFFWASCVPSSCHYEDFRRLVQCQFDNFFNGTDVQIKIKADEKLCQVETQSEVTSNAGSTMVM